MRALERLVARRSQAAGRLLGRLSRADGLLQQPLDAAAGPHVWVRRRRLLNFASTNYLGRSRDPRLLRAVRRSLPVWGISLGMPRLLATDGLTARLEPAIARLVGQEQALLFPSTTHIALDLLPLLAGPDGLILIDERAYPISREGARAAAGRGARVRSFPHDDCATLARLLHASAGRRDTVIVCDGVYPAEGRPAPLDRFARLAEAYDAVVYVDDAHGIGVLGAKPDAGMPYGHGGGGTPRHLGVPPGALVHVGSLSKAFGVPLAFVAGPAAFIDHLRLSAPTVTHSSPPALPVVAAALAALDLHSFEGEARRRRLLDRVRRFRAGLAAIGILATGPSLFPIQSVHYPTPQASILAARTLRRRGVWAILQLGPPDCPHGGVLRFALSPHHSDADLDVAVAAVAATTAGRRNAFPAGARRNSGELGGTEGNGR